MPRITDLGRVRALLERDRIWAAYALGDLSPGFADHCEWIASENGEALALLYRAFSPPILFAMGAAARLASIVREIDDDEVSLHVRTDALPALRPRFEVTDARPVWRMAVSRDAFRPADLRGVETLGPADLADIERLYADGLARGESPDFFFSSMLQQGMFRGVRRRGELVAVAGTHLFAPGVGVCAIGNVYTRLDCRGRGLASVVTSAVVAEAFGRCAETVVLNVRQTNDAARRVYERLGFERYCEFVEGEARRAPQ